MPFIVVKKKGIVLTLTHMYLIYSCGYMQKLHVSLKSRKKTKNTKTLQDGMTSGVVFTALIMMVYQLPSKTTKLTFANMSN